MEVETACFVLVMLRGEVYDPVYHRISIFSGRTVITRLFRCFLEVSKDYPCDCYDCH